VSITQDERAARFRALHDGHGTFVIPNPWDVGSARILAGLGFQALATSSAASASALGRRDHGLTRDEALAHARLIVDPTDLPVSADLGKIFAFSRCYENAAASTFVGMSLQVDFGAGFGAGFGLITRFSRL
jgi:2-methylisocitrate lyase-like PEP mutase family enzyme